MIRKTPLILMSLASIFVLMALFFPTVPASAQLEGVCTVNEGSDLCLENTQTQGRGASRGLYGSGGLLTNIANLVSIITGVASVIMIMIAAFRYIRSSGDASNTSNAQNTMIYAAIGLIVAGIAQLLVVFVLNRTPLP